GDDWPRSRLHRPAPGGCDASRPGRPLAGHRVLVVVAGGAESWSRAFGPALVKKVCAICVRNPHWGVAAWWSRGPMSERDIFIAALQQDAPAQRRAYLDEACAGQPTLRRQVEDLLRLHEGAGSFLQQPAAEAGATGAFLGAADQAASPEAPGAAIGPY